MSVYRYSKYKIRVAPDSKKTQGLQVGDIVRRQYAERDKSIYSLMAVLETGVDVIGDNESPFFIGALLDGDEPQSGELLDFVRLTNLMDTSRSGAMYLTASDNDSPYMDVIDGMATEQSLCFPTMTGGVVNMPDKAKYATFGSDLSVSYQNGTVDASRIIRVTRTSTTSSVGIKQTLEEKVEHPQRLLVSFRTRASKANQPVSLFFGYTQDDSKLDAQEAITISTEWSYHLWVITIEYPKQYTRSLSIGLDGVLSAVGDWCEIADLNIVRMSSVSVFTNASKARVGKVKGIIDPIFGVLDGYGAYFQNLYATRNVNIAGTLTAGDENGFGSTFYVGKIHKNVLTDSLSCVFSGGTTSSDIPPVGIGDCTRIMTDSQIHAQSAEWREKHVGKYYCFSLWIKTESITTVKVYQDEHLVDTLSIENVDEWVRYKISFPIRASAAPGMNIKIVTDVPLVLCAPQLEAGKSATPYQATDATLNYTEDYGAWFNKGGVGGTIQNPLLRFNDDGSISSRDNAFIIYPDGTGQFASGRLKWSKDTIELKEVTLRWEELDEQAKEQMLPITVYVESVNGTTFRTGEISTTLIARAYRGGIEITGQIPDTNFRWTRSSKDSEGDAKWNAVTRTGRELSITDYDVSDNSVFDCEVTVPS